MSKQELLDLGTTDIEERSVEYLRSLGYVVLPPDKFLKEKLEDYSDIRTATDLVDFFYKRLMLYKPRRHLHHTRSSVDKKHASSFIKARMSLGISKIRAARECALIIDTLLKHERLFNLSQPITSLRSFGQNEMKWLTDAIILFINKERTLETELLERQELEEMIREWGREDYGIEH